MGPARQNFQFPARQRARHSSQGPPYGLVGAYWLILTRLGNCRGSSGGRQVFVKRRGRRLCQWWWQWLAQWLAIGGDKLAYGITPRFRQMACRQEARGLCVS